MGNTSSLDDVPYSSPLLESEYINSHKNDYLTHNYHYQKSYKHKKFDVVDEFYDQEFKMLKSRLIFLNNNLRSTTLYFDNGNPYLHDGFENRLKLKIIYYKTGYMKSHETFTQDNNLCGKQFYYTENGYLERFTEYSSAKHNDGKKYGQDVLYDGSPRQKIAVVVNYKSGLKHGESFYNGEDEKVVRYDNYKNNKLHGKCYEYKESRYFYHCYQDGVLIQTTFSLV